MRFITRNNAYNVIKNVNPALNSKNAVLVLINIFVQFKLIHVSVWMDIIRSQIILIRFVINVMIFAKHANLNINVQAAKLQISLGILIIKIANVWLDIFN